MRGTNLLTAGLEPVPEEVVNNEVSANMPETNIQQNTAGSKGSIIWWLVLAGLYLAWDMIQNKSKLGDSLDPANIRANFHNIVVIGIAAVVFLNGMNVLCTKLAAMKIPGVSKLAGSLLPLFNL
jgi:uncharacterized membrane protein YccF (DUF307 family)